MAFCRELRQVLSDILPGGSVSPSISERTSTDSRARSDESNKHASNINGSVGNDVSQQRSTDVAAEPSGIVDAYATPLLAAETSEDNDTFDQYGLAADPVHSQRDYLTHHQVAAGLSPFKTLSGKKVLSLSLVQYSGKFVSLKICGCSVGQTTMSQFSSPWKWGTAISLIKMTSSF